MSTNKLAHTSPAPVKITRPQVITKSCHTSHTRPSCPLTVILSVTHSFPLISLDRCILRECYLIQMISPSDWATNPDKFHSHCIDSWSLPPRSIQCVTGLTETKTTTIKKKKKKNLTWNTININWNTVYMYDKNTQQNN